MRSKSVHLILLLGLIGLTAVLFRPDRPDTEIPRLRWEMQDALRQLWGEVPCQVELDGESSRVSARVSQMFPEGTRRGRRAWSYKLLRFVALAHPKIELSKLQIEDSAKHELVEETPKPHRHHSTSEEQRARLQGLLDRDIGPGQTLVLLRHSFRNDLHFFDHPELVLVLRESNSALEAACKRVIEANGFGVGLLRVVTLKPSGA